MNTSELYEGTTLDPRITSALEAAKRRQWLSKRVPRCLCGTQQVQLTDSSAVPAKWKCRKCATKFEFEPEG